MSADPYVNTGLFTKTIYTLAALPAEAARLGGIEWISDSTVGGVIGKGLLAVGGGTYKCKVISDGTDWRIFG